jgi:hypothetical protein
MLIAEFSDRNSCHSEHHADHDNCHDHDNYRESCHDVENIVGDDCVPLPILLGLPAPGLIPIGDDVLLPIELELPAPELILLDDDLILLGGDILAPVAVVD